MECSLEELLVALSDKLWKGQRVEILELQAVDRVAEYLNVDKWDVYLKLYQAFEGIASEGYERLQHSVFS